MADLTPSSDAPPITFREALPYMHVPFLSAVGTVAFIFPAMSTVRRYRMQYAPKGSREEQTGAMDMLRTIWNKEGLSGIYRGSILAFSEIVLPAVAAYIVQFRLIPGLPLWTAQSPQASRVIGQAALSLASLGLAIVSGVTLAKVLASARPFTLSTPVDNFQRLFSSKERSGFFSSIFTASRFLVRLVPYAATSFVSWYMPNNSPLSSTGFGGSRPVVLAVTLALSLFSVPFSVMSERLDVQRATDSVGETAGKSSSKEVDETFVQLRSQPYRDLKDCFNSIVEEEGYSALFKGWYFEVACVLGTAALQYWVEGQEAAFQARQAASALAKSQ